MTDYIIYLLSSVMLGSTILVIGVHNPIHSILLLILVFVLGSLILFFIQMEVFGLIFLIVYVGAIVILFLFIIMILYIKVLNTAQKIREFFSYRNSLIAIVLLEILIYINQDFFFLLKNEHLTEVSNSEFVFSHPYVDFSAYIKPLSHLSSIGEALFTEAHNIEAFILTGILLFVAMVGAIIVTIDEGNKKTVKQQNVGMQVIKSVDNTVYNLKTLK